MTTIDDNVRYIQVRLGKPQYAQSSSAPVTSPAPAFSPPDRSRTSPIGSAKVMANLDLDIQDRDGVETIARNDIKGTLNGSVVVSRDILDKALDKAEGKSGISSVSFNAKEFAYVFRGTAHDPVFDFVPLDDFELKLKDDGAGKLMIDLDDNWLPNSSILDEVRSAVRDMIKKELGSQVREVIDIDVQMTRQGDKLYFEPVIKQIVVPLGQDDSIQIKDLQGQNSSSLGHFWIDGGGNLNLAFNNLEFTASSNPDGKASQAESKADRARLQVKAEVGSDLDVKIDVKGTVDIDLSESEAQKMAFKDEKMSNYIERVGLHADIKAHIELDKRKNVKVKAENKWRLENVKIEGKTYERIELVNTGVRLDNRKGLQLDIQQSMPIAPFQPKLTKNTLENFIDGPAYYEEMMTAVQGAKESIDMETYLFYEGETTRKLARQMALKAAGLKDGSSRLVYDPKATSGIPVHILFNTRLTKKGTEETQKILRETVQQLQADIDALPIDAAAKKDYKQRLAKNLQWQALTDGIAKADHRKILIIDGKTGYTGGINMGDHFLKKDSYHDLMMKVNGPAVREMHQALIENWSDFGGDPQQTWNLKSTRELASHRDRYARQHNLSAGNVDVLMTDDRNTEIESAIITTIRNAQTEINIEHPYFYHPATQEALLDALKRGVTINITIPNKSDEDPYNILNTENIRQLMQAQQRLGKGQVNAYLYTGRGGKYDHMAHTKAISADGQYAVVGSANLTPRSLHPVFQQVEANGDRKNILFNEEMSFYLADPKQVQKLNEQLFQHDWKNSTKKVTLSDIEARLKQLGGPKALQEQRLKAHLG